MVSDTNLLHLCLFYGCKWQLQKARRIPQSAGRLRVINEYYPTSAYNATLGYIYLYKVDYLESELRVY